MKKSFYLSVILLMAMLYSNAQDFLPFSSSNYAGITGLSLQPASIADSRYKFDLSLASTSAMFSNNFYGLDPYVLWHPSLLKELDFKSPYITRNLDGKDKTGIVSERQDIFSFMISLSDKDAIAFTPSVRTIVNIDNMTESTAILLDKLDQETDLWKLKLKNENLSAQANSWVEYGFTYARVLMDNHKHFLKAGATLKINQGLGSAYMFIKDLNYEVNGEDTISLYNSYTNYGASDNLTEDYQYKFNTNPSLSLDLGFVYEYRPQWMKFKYDMDGETNLWRKDQNKYLFRIGFTMSDLGSVRYRRNPLSADFNADIHNWDISELNISSIADLNAVIDSNFTYYDVSDNYRMNLPLCLSLQADVRLAQGLYLNVTPFLALNQGNSNVNKVHYLSSINIVPRYDLKWFGISFPIQYNMYKQWNVGLGLRLGPVWVGWNDMFSAMTTTKSRYGSSASVVLKVPIYYGHPHDKDKDNVSDKVDQCPDVAGIWELKGCPDADGDGITDAKDKCPEVAGLKEFDGCPDTDGDGIIDNLDQCPDVKGIDLFNGCPDSDGDSIIDQNDECPYNAGPAAMNGCPDQDGDGIRDKDDNCPTLIGSLQNKGCPFTDSDGDGIIDESDKCPGIKGPVDNFGCPYQDTDNDSIPDKDDDCPSIAGKAVFKGCPDTDGDGISDKIDMCPTIAGSPANNGCPVIKKEEQAILDKAFSNLEFETGKSTIRATSFSSLDQLAGVLKNRPEFKLALEGHTDNVGNPQSNLNLSKNRTLAVKNYLVKKGIDAGRIKAEWYGQTKPVAPNNTTEGRQKNRRVEMKIFFE